MVMVEGVIVVVWWFEAGRRKSFSRAHWLRGAEAVVMLAVLICIWLIISKIYGPSYVKFSWEQLRDDFWRPLAGIVHVANGPMFFGILVIVAASVFFAAALNWLSKENWRFFLVLTSALASLFAVWYVLITAMEWTRLNLYHPRYYYPVMILAFLPVMFLLSRLATGKPQRRILAVLAILTAAVFLVGNRHQLTGLRDPMSARIFERVNVLAPFAGARLYVGNYWTSWPLVVRDLAHGAESYGITGRGEENRRAVLDFVRRQFASGQSVSVVCTEDSTESCWRRIRSFLGYGVALSHRPMASAVEFTVQGREDFEMPARFELAADDLTPFRGAAVFDKGVIRQTADGSGILSFGPYVRLAPGKYRFQATYEARNGSEPKFDVWSNEVGRAAEGRLADEASRTFVIEDKVPEALWEIRTYCSRDCGFVLTGLTVERLTSVP